MDSQRKFYTVITDLYHLRLPYHLEQGYETRELFEQSLRSLAEQWKGRIGEMSGERNGFYLLRFYDMPGGKPEEKWLPSYLLEEVPMPEYLKEEPPQYDEVQAALDEAFGFD